MNILFLLENTQGCAREHPREHRYSSAVHVCLFVNVVLFVFYSMVASYTTSIGYKADDFMKWLGNSDYDWSARVEWKYGCSSKSENPKFSYVIGSSLFGLYFERGQYIGLK